MKQRVIAKHMKRNKNQPVTDANGQLTVKSKSYAAARQKALRECEAYVEQLNAINEERSQ